jgi:hypothetical protein
MELLANPQFMAALRKVESGRAKWLPLSALDEK